MNFEEFAEVLPTEQFQESHNQPLTREQFLEHILWEILSNEEHALYSIREGDGYQEPISESWHCSCADEGTGDSWAGPGFIQTDPQCSTQPSLDEVLHEWQKHLNYQRSVLW